MALIPYSDKSLRLLTGIFIFMLWQLNLLSVTGAGFSIRTALVDSGINALLMVFISATIGRIFRYYQPPASRFWIILSVTAVFAMLFTVLANLLLKAVLPQDLAYTDFLDSTTGIRMGFAILMTLWILVLKLLWNMLEQEKRASGQQEEMMAMAREAELHKLRQQLQPHFLFNSLNSINALVGSRPAEARNMIEQLSAFLRSTVNARDNQLVPLNEELELVDRYLQIEKFRFGHRLRVDIEVSPEAAAALLPPLMLQPLVENAIKFGLYDTTGEVVIGLRASQADGFLYLAITNPYDPGTSSTMKGTGFGLKGLQRRLYLLFGRSDLLQASGRENEFITQVKIPQNYV